MLLLIHYDFETDRTNILPQLKILLTGSHRSATDRLTQEVTVLLDQHPQQVDYAISGWFALDVTDSWVFKQFIATAGHTAKKKEGERTKRSTSKLLKI